MKDPNGSTGAGATRNSDDISTDPALSSHTFTGSADRVALRVTPAHGDAPLGAVEVIDAASQPVGTTPPQAEIVVRQVYPDTIVPTTPFHTAPSPPLPVPPGPPPSTSMQGPTHGGNGGRSRRVWFGIAAIIVALLAIGFLVLQSSQRSADTVRPTATASALVGVPATPAGSLTPTLAPLPTPVPTAVPLTSTLIPPTEVPSPTDVPTATVAPPTIATAAPITVPVTVPTVVPPTSVPTAPPPPAAVPAASPAQGAIPAAPVSRPALPPLPPGVQLPPTNIPQLPQNPRKPPVP